MSYSFWVIHLLPIYIDCIHIIKILYSQERSFGILSSDEISIILRHKQYKNSNCIVYRLYRGIDANQNICLSNRYTYQMTKIYTNNSINSIVYFYKFHKDCSYQIYIDFESSYINKKKH